MSLTDRLTGQSGSGEVISITPLGVDEAKLHDMQLRANRKHHRALYGRHNGRRDGRLARETNATNGYGARTRYNPHVPRVRDPLYLRRHERLDIEQQLAEFFEENGGNGNGLYGLLNREAPGLLESHPLRLVSQLIRRYGVQVVIEGYQASQVTGFPFVAEVIASSSEARSRADDEVYRDVLEIFADAQRTGIQASEMIDPLLMKVLVQRQKRNVTPASQVYSSNPVYRDSPTAETHFWEHQDERALEHRV